MENKIVFIDKNNYEKRAVAILRHTGNLRLVGETGTGKTTFVHYLCQKYNWKLYEISLTSDTTRWDLVAQDILVKGETKVRKGIVTRWIEDKDKNYDAIVLYLDELNYADPSVLSLLNSLSDFRKELYIPELNKTLYRSEKHYIIVSYNPSEVSGYTGTFKVNIAQLRRFEGLIFRWLNAFVEIGYLKDKLIEYGVTKTRAYNLAKKLVDNAQRTRIAYVQGQISFPVTTGNLLNYCRLLANGLDLDDIKELVLSFYPYEEQKKVRELWV